MQASLAKYGYAYCYKNAIEDRIPVVAECGGFMYLHPAIKDKEEKCHKMVEAIPSVCHYTGKPVRFGYLEIEEKNGSFYQRVKE